MKKILLLFNISSIFLFFAIQQNKTLEESINDGQMIYNDFCLQCHLPNGQGVEGSFPPLAKTDYLFENIDRSITTIKYGTQGPIVVNGIEYKGMMTSQGLDDQEIADVVNYILNSWGNSYDQMITADRVKSIEVIN